MEPAIPVIFIGPSGTGKTLIIRSISGNQNEVFPTAGFQIAYLSNLSRTILAYDLSGEGSTRSNWNLFCGLSDNAVYVIDASRPSIFVNAKRHLFNFLQQNKSMKTKNLCIMLNKCDLKERPPKELYIRALEQDKLAKLVGKVYIKETSAFNKQGIDECLEWLIKNTISNGQK